MSKERPRHPPREAEQSAKRGARRKAQPQLAPLSCPAQIPQGREQRSGSTSRGTALQQLTPLSCPRHVRSKGENRKVLPRGTSCGSPSRPCHFLSLFSSAAIFVSSTDAGKREQRGVDPRAEALPCSSIQSRWLPISSVLGTHTGARHCPLHRWHSGQGMLPRRRRDLRLREAPLKLFAAAAVLSPAAAAAAAADQRLRLRRRRLLGACGPCHSTGTLYVQKRRRQHACSVIAHVDD